MVSFLVVMDLEMVTTFRFFFMNDLTGLKANYHLVALDVMKYKANLQGNIFTWKRTRNIMYVKHIIIKITLQNDAGYMSEENMVLFSESCKKKLGFISNYILALNMIFFLTDLHWIKLVTNVVTGIDEMVSCQGQFFIHSYN